MTYEQRLYSYEVEKAALIKLNLIADEYEKQLIKLAQKYNI